MNLKLILMNFTSRIIAVGLLFISILFSCGGGNDPEPPTPPPVVPDNISITVNPSAVKQEMVGFGGALTWYSTWVTDNNKVNEIADLMFTDLGIDIIRFKNWYYPNNYPTDKTTTNMPDDNAKVHWDATNKLYDMAKSRNPNVKILFSSWGPPKVLKDNGKLQEGTLNKDGSGFMYDAFAQYWEDVLDNVPFDPDYISIQNEPTYVNSGWTTCKWAINETTSLPGYNTAFNKVYDKIKNRAHVPVMIGPESQDVSTFVSFANVLKDNANCSIYAFHPYNLNSGTSSATINASLQNVGNFSTKPNLMTEFSDNITDWFSTALFIHNSLVYANTSGYIYWKLAWNTPSSGEDNAMISMSSASPTATYKVTPYYYLIKHFSKHVDAGYHRVEVSSSNTLLFSTAFISPDNKKITIVTINNGSESVKVNFEATGKTITGISATQSKGTSFYQPAEVALSTKSMSLPAKSITTVVLNF